MIQIAVINASTVVNDLDVKKMVDAIQVQIDRDWTPAWGIPAKLTVVPHGQKPPSGMWWQTIFDTADQAGALGYHDLTSAGLPIGKVFAKTTLEAGDRVSVTLSHEVLEMLGDPDINLMVQKGPRGYAYEVCDAVEDDSLGYDINGVRVSDFVYPQYFETFWHKGAAKFDHLATSRDRCRASPTAATCRTSISPRGSGNRSPPVSTTAAAPIGTTAPCW